MRFLLKCVIAIVFSGSTIFSFAQGNALNFDGVNDYVSFANTSALGVTKFTIETWVYWDPSNASNVEFLCSKGNERLEVQLGGAANSIRFIPAPGVFLDAANALATGQWVHLALMYDPSQSFAAIYVNAEAKPFVNNGPAPLTTAVGADGNDFFLGRRNAVAPYHFKGSLDEFRVFNNTRTAAEVTADMRSTISAGLSSLVHYNIFNAGSAGSDNTFSTTLIDISASNNSGTLQNFALSGTTSNWIESYAMVVPVVTAASLLTGTSFFANWLSPTVGIVDSFLLDVSSSANFSSFVPGYQSLGVAGNSKIVTGLTSATPYYYRVRAKKASIGNQGAYSSTMATGILPYTFPGNCLNFDGVNDFVSVPSSAAFNVSAVTIQGWVRWTPSSATDVQFICSKGYENLELHLGGGVGANSLRFIPTSGVVIDVPNAVPSGIWTHISCSYNPAASEAKVFVNGVAQIITTSGSPLNTALVYNSNAFEIGRRAQSGGYYFSGSLDEFRVFNNVRTDAQIQADMLDEIPSNTAGLIQYFGFNQGIPSGLNTAVTQVNDASPSAAHGTLFNSSLTGSVSNWIESYAMVVPQTTSVSRVTSGTADANWNAPAKGTVDFYTIDVSTNPNFSSFLPGFANKNVGLVGSTTMTGLANSANYYYRVKANKSSVNGQGAISNSTSFQTFTPPGNGLDFKNSDQVVIPANPALFPVGIAVTIEVWVYLRVHNGYGNPIFSSVMVNQPTFRGMELDVLANGGVQFSPYNGVRFESQGGMVPVNQWTHITCQYYARPHPEQSPFFKIYINGLEKTTSVNVGAGHYYYQVGAYQQNTYPMYLGATPNDGYGFTGSLDEFKIFNTLRTAEQIKSDMLNTTPSNEPGLLVYYNFDNGIANGNNTGDIKNAYLYDASQNRHNATLNAHTLNGTTSNWVGSYAMVQAKALAPSNVGYSSFVARWQAPSVNSVDYYLLDVATDAGFTNLIPGYSNLNVGNITNYTVSGLQNGIYYYYRVKPYKAVTMYNVAYSNTAIAFTSIFSKPGNALNLDGTNDHIATSHNTDFVTSQFTIEAWVLWNPSNATDVQFITSKGDGNMELQVGGLANRLRFMPTPGVILDAAVPFPTGAGCMWLLLTILQAIVH